MSDNAKHIIVNGEIASASLPSLYHNNLSFMFGDGVHEYMHAYGTEIQFVDSHFQRLYKSMQTLGIGIDDNIAQQKIVKEIAKLLNRDKAFGGIKIKLTVYRNTNFQYGYVVSYEELISGNYQINQKGLNLGVFRDIRKHYNILSAISSNNMLLNVLADNYARMENFDEVLLLNHNGNIIESSHSNVFIVKGNKIYTPSIDEGCIEGIMREHVLKAAKDAGFESFNNCIITEKNISDADEVFLTNTVEGIKWVIAFGQRRYYNKVAKILCDKLNQIAFK